MAQFITHISLLVDDYDAAIEFYTQKLNFILMEDTKLSDTKRWVLIKPSPSAECCLLLAKASSSFQKTRVGDQTGGRVFLFLQTDHFWTDYQQMLDKGIRFIREPKEENYGIVAVFEDLYGNKWDLIQAKK
eukprot:gene7106-7171_t